MDENKDLSGELVAPEEEYKDGCPTCGTKDIQSAELLEAWKNIEELKATLAKAQAALPVDSAQHVGIGAATETPNPVDWHDRYNQIKFAYIKTRLEVSGSFGSWDYATRKRVLENEVSKELGFIV